MARFSNMAQISQAMNRFVTISQRTFEFLDEVPKVQQKAETDTPPSRGRAHRIRPRHLWLQPLLSGDQGCHLPH